MSRATGGGGQAIIEESTLEWKREEIVSQSGGYRSLDELDRERERKRQELYLEERQREKGGAGAGRIEIFDERQQQQQQQGSTGGGMAGAGFKSLDELDRERERKRQELYLEERQREKGGAGALGADRIEVIDEKDLKATGAMAHPTRATATGLRSLLPTWSSTTGAAKPASEADQRLQHAAKEMSEALVLKAGELKDSAVHMTSSLGKKYSTYLPARFSKAYGGEMPEWERYGRKMDDANRLLVKAERISNEAKNAPPSRAAELYLKANKSRQKALQKAMAAQELAGRMKRAIDDKLYQIQRGLPMQRDIWELYGATRLRAQELLDRAEALQRESNATTDKTKAAELCNDSIHIRKKAIRKAQKAQKFAEEIQRQSELRVEELKQRSMGSTSLGSGTSGTSSGASY
jgi:hypothetical protein